MGSGHSRSPSLSDAFKIWSPKETEKAAEQARKGKGGGGGAGLIEQLRGEVAAQGNTVRQLKKDKADKAAIKAEVEVLLALKKKLEAAGGEPANNNAKSKKKQKKQKQKQNP